MNCYRIQLQTILYKNKISSLIRSLEHIANAVRVYKNSGHNHLILNIVYGDASPTPLFDSQAVASLQTNFARAFTFSYKYFNENTGTAKGHNLLAHNAQCDYIMVMNPDIIVNPLIFSQLITPFEQHNLVGLTEARQTPLEHPKNYHSATGETSWASTACVLIQKAAFDVVDGFDSHTFFMYCDDVDFSWTLRLKGYKIIYCPNAVVFHDKSLSIDANWQPTSAEIYYSAEAALLMAYKWSAPNRLNNLLDQFSKSSVEGEKKAAQKFIERQAQKQLPQQLDPHHQIADFSSFGYGEMRFTY